jgi:hypothetical protein
MLQAQEHLATSLALLATISFPLNRACRVLIISWGMRFSSMAPVATMFLITARAGPTAACEGDMDVQPKYGAQYYI